MNYVVTARKWRPQKFEEVIGQEHISKTIKNAILNKRIAHAYLFAGPRGVGKTTTARILAKALNCKNSVKGEPCNQCDTCKSFNSSQSLDIIEIDGASNRRIDEIRALREAVKYSPTSGSYKIFIIDEVHMLTTESFNALLKTLEEPPEHAIFIFATTDVHKVPLTIISRCQRFDFRRIELVAIKTQLLKIAENDGISIDDHALTYIAKKADGALRDAQSLFDQVISFGGKNIDSQIVASMLNLIDEDIYFRISDAILNKHFIEAFKVSKLLYDNGWNYIDFISELIEHFRNILTVILKEDSTFVESSERIKSMYLEYIKTFTESDLLRILTYLAKVEGELKISQNQKLLMEISLSHLIGLESTTTISQLLNSIQTGILPEGLEKKKSINLESTVKASNTVNSTIKNTDGNTKSSTPTEPTQNISNVDSNLSDAESSLINAIINELGGREFK
jgi:DNA polymerase-3 subunit gamma/tau